MDWVRDFYELQDAWSGIYTGPIQAYHQEKADIIARYVDQPARILELGGGGGQVAAATVDLGHKVTVIELVPHLAAHARNLAATFPGGQMVVVQGDFYEVELEGPFDLICYWDGFGLGSDADQQRLLRRMAGWLAPDGIVLLDVYTPWHWAAAAGASYPVGDTGIMRAYDFDGDGCRMLDSWWPQGEEHELVTQSLRCYSPADLRLLLQGTGLKLVEVEAGGAVDFRAGQYIPEAPLHQAMQFLAQLARDDADD